jgi:hypothetical protein
MGLENVLEGTEKALNYEPNQKINYPIALGMPAAAPSLYFEYAISGQQNEKREAIPQIMKILDSGGVRIVSLSFFYDQSMEGFAMNVVCDFTTSKTHEDQLLIKLNKSKFVKLAEMSPLEGRVFSNFMFPLTFFGGEIRAVAIDSDRFVHLFENITKSFGIRAKESLYENGRTEGREIMEALKEKLGQRLANDRTVLLDNAKALFQAAGWGKLLFHNEGAEIYKATITEPPSDAEGGAVLGNHFLQGVVAGIIESFLKPDVKLTMLREGYEEQRANLVLYYMDKAAIKELSREGDEGKEEEEEDENVDEETIRARKLVVAPAPKLDLKQQEESEDAAIQVAQVIKSINQIEEGAETSSQQQVAKNNPVVVVAASTTPSGNASVIVNPSAPPQQMPRHVEERQQMQRENEVPQVQQLRQEQPIQIAPRPKNVRAVSTTAAAATVSTAPSAEPVATAPPAKVVKQGEMLGYGGVQIVQPPPEQPPTPARKSPRKRTPRARAQQQEVQRQRIQESSDDDNYSSVDTVTF